MELSRKLFMRKNMKRNLTNYTKICGMLSLLLLNSSLYAGEDKTINDYINDLNSGDSYLQQEACRYLGNEKKNSAVETLIFLLEEQTTDVLVQIEAAWALSMIGKEAGVSDILLSTAQSNRSTAVRYAAFLALIKLDDKEKTGEIRELVIEMESSGDIYLRDIAKKLRSKFEKK